MESTIPTGTPTIMVPVTNTVSATTATGVKIKTGYAQSLRFERFAKE